MSPTTSIPVFPISAVIVVTFLDSDPAGCTTLAASLSFISCFGLTCDCAELITFSTLGSAFDPSRYDTTQDRCIPSKPRFAKSDRPATDVRQTRATDAAHNSPAHEAGASRGGTWSTDHELSTHASLRSGLAFPAGLCHATEKLSCLTFRFISEQTRALPPDKEFRSPAQDAPRSRSSRARRECSINCCSVSTPACNRVIAPLTRGHERGRNNPYAKPPTSPLSCRYCKNWRPAPCFLNGQDF